MTAVFLVFLDGTEGIMPTDGLRFSFGFKVELVDMPLHFATLLPSLATYYRVTDQETGLCHEPYLLYRLKVT